MSDRSADPTRPFEPPDPAATLSVGHAGSSTAPPDLLPNYAFVAEVGRGTMGVVHAARQHPLDRTAAVKMVLAGGHVGPKESARFLAEVRAAAAVDHLHVVRVYESGEHRGVPYLAMELAGGGTLARRLAGGRLPPREAVGLVVKVARGVQAAHDAGVVHRDLKPGNVLLTLDGTPKVADFGLAKRPGESDLTHTGAILGTPGYMAPEQARGTSREVGPAADVYALGAVLFACLSGRPPFVGTDPLDVVMQAANAEPPCVRQFVKTVPRDLAIICAKCLRTAPADRYLSASALADDLGRYLAGRHILARPTGWAERRWKWVRRNPALSAAGLLVVVFGMALAGVVLLMASAPGRPDDGPTGRPLPTASPTPDDTYISARPGLVVEQFLAAASADPTGADARRWATPEYEFRYGSAPAPGEPDRPYYHVTAATIMESGSTPVGYKGFGLRFLGVGMVARRQLAADRSGEYLPSGGNVGFTLTLLRDWKKGWRVDSFEYDGRPSRMGPANLPADQDEREVSEVTGMPLGPWGTSRLAEARRKLGLRSWVFYHSGGPVQVRLAVEESGQATIDPTKPVAGAGPTYTSPALEGRICFHVGRVPREGTLEPTDDVRIGLNREPATGTASLGLWYGWKGTEFEEEVTPADLTG